MLFPVGGSHHGGEEGTACGGLLRQCIYQYCGDVSSFNFFNTLPKNNSDSTPISEEECCHIETEANGIG